MELACTSPWKTVISIYKNLHTSGFLLGALCLFKSTFFMISAASPPPQCLQTRQPWAKRGRGEPMLPRKCLPRQFLPSKLWKSSRSQHLCLDRLGWHICVWTCRSVLATPKRQFICCRHELILGSNNLEFQDGQNPLYLICRRSSHSHLPGTQIKGNLVRPREPLLQDLAHEGGQSLVPRFVGGFRQVISLPPSSVSSSVAQWCLQYGVVGFPSGHPALVVFLERLLSSFRIPHGMEWRQLQITGSIQAPGERSSLGKPSEWTSVVLPRPPYTL